MSAPTKSHYAQKRDRGEQMYGPGCCAHSVTDAQINAAKEAARKRGHFAPQLPREAFDPIMYRMRRSWDMDVRR